MWGIGTPWARGQANNYKWHGCPGSDKRRTGGTTNGLIFNIIFICIFIISIANIIVICIFIIIIIIVIILIIFLC